MKQLLANLFVIFVFSSVPARFFSGMNGAFMYQGCVEGLIYIGNDDPEYICVSALDSYVNTPAWWLFCSIVLAFGIYKTIGFWDPDKD
tara:strand:- start:1285 stop:1548 length:264 start_codon:yes stop_codon:yes gene_type:complete